PGPRSAPGGSPLPPGPAPASRRPGRPGRRPPAGTTCCAAPSPPCSGAGTTHRLIVDAYGHELRADVGDLRQPPQAGDPVALTFDADDAVLLPGGLAGGDLVG
ncbi:2-aminoethylphosphonate ABC transport system ATP-binding subunit PhnT, partial [Streptomyces sp. SID4948]|nr:2-aminoethylphosphonate ABC transport system ATP-binding subunit PhnT [Streptomyces sp. SID4948]